MDRFGITGYRCEPFPKIPCELKPICCGEKFFTQSLNKRRHGANRVLRLFFFVIGRGRSEI
jgi:hypothetical protein